MFGARPWPSPFNPPSSERGLEGDRPQFFEPPPAEAEITKKRLLWRVGPGATRGLQGEPWRRVDRGRTFFVWASWTPGQLMWHTEPPPTLLMLTEAVHFSSGHPGPLARLCGTQNPLLLLQCLQRPYIFRLGVLLVVLVVLPFGSCSSRRPHIFRLGAPAIPVTALE